MTHGREPDAHAEACHSPGPGRENASRPAAGPPAHPRSVAKQTFTHRLIPSLRHVCRDVLDYALKMKEMTEVNARIDVLERTVSERGRRA